jgi:hypothetical protein
VAYEVPPDAVRDKVGRPLSESLMEASMPYHAGAQIFPERNVCGDEHFAIGGEICGASGWHRQEDGYGGLHKRRGINFTIIIHFFSSLTLNISNYLVLQHGSS